MERFVDKHFQEWFAELQIPPLRYASVGMTKERVALPFRFDAKDDEQQVPPLRYAPVGMTPLLGMHKRTHSARQALSMEASFPLSSRAKPRDLRFNGSL
jgi:hypothetical protein